MFVLRPGNKKDLKNVYELTLNATTGLTTLPPNKPFLKEKLLSTEKSFSGKNTTPSGELYFFVLENLKEKKIVGTSAILSSIGQDMPFYSYRLCFETFKSNHLNINKNIPLLKLKKVRHGPSEICSLFLDSNYRKGGLGRLLSLGRFLFIANHPKRFQKKIIAEMRGFSDQCIVSPFWEYIGRPFYEIDFQHADTLSTFQPDFIEALIPKEAIYLNLMPKRIMKYIAKPHPNTLPALKMLNQEGFSFDYEVDIFDAGPQISCSTQSLRCIKESQIKGFEKSSEPLENTEMLLVSNLARSPVDFRCTLTPVAFSSRNQKVALDPATIRMLKLKSGDKIRISPPRAKKEDAKWKKVYSSMVNGNWEKQKR
jgi:arginine N-succinyltransferase